MNIPLRVRSLMNTLISAGYEAYVVGGCVRDALLDQNPKDWDLTTNAKPDQIKAVFSSFKLINNNGEKHGTVTVMSEDEPFEITTYRTESNYTDHRHPDEVKFVDLLEADLSRRDFTINAMAADVSGNIIDPFGGKLDLANHLIRCVGNAGHRFEEDALRILRALRFASKYNFFIDYETSKAMLDRLDLLKNISAERIQSELVKTIVGPGFTRLMRSDLKLVLSAVIPDLYPMFYFDQKNRYNKHDNLWEHSLTVVDGVAQTNYIERIAALLHDIGKCTCYTESMLDNSSVLIRLYDMHNYASYNLAKEILTSLRFSIDDQNKILFLIKYHNFNLSIPNKLIAVKRLLQFLPESGRDRLFKDLITLKTADTVDHVDGDPEYFHGIIARYNYIITNNICYSLRQLAVSGDDLVSLGYGGKLVGIILSDCLDKVIEEQLVNSKPALLAYINKYYDGDEQICQN